MNAVVECLFGEPGSSYRWMCYIVGVCILAGVVSGIGVAIICKWKKTKILSINNFFYFFLKKTTKKLTK